MMTQRQSADERLFDFICRYSDDNRGLTPSLDEICAAMGWASKITASRHVDRLEANGWIRRYRAGDGCSNNIEIVMEPKPRGRLIAHNLRLSDFPLNPALIALESCDRADERRSA